MLFFWLIFLKFILQIVYQCNILLVDVSGTYEQVESTILQAQEELGAIFLLANCAGYARAAKFEDITIGEIKVYGL